MDNLFLTTSCGNLKIHMNSYCDCPKTSDYNNKHCFICKKCSERDYFGFEKIKIVDIYNFPEYQIEGTVCQNCLKWIQDNERCLVGLNPNNKTTRVRVAKYLKIKNHPFGVFWAWVCGKNKSSLYEKECEMIWEEA